MAAGNKAYTVQESTNPYCAGVVGTSSTTPSRALINNEGKDDPRQQKAPKEFTGMKFTHALIKHLDQLYSKMLAGEVKEIASEPEYDSKQKVIEGQTGALVLNEKEAFYNPGNSAVTESM
jgi:hypothetical protein